VLGTIALLVVGACVGTLGTASMAANAYKFKFEHADHREQSLQVTGSARKRIRSDLAVWKVHISSDKKTLAEAFAELKSGGEKVQAFLQKHGFKPDEITAGAVQTQPIRHVEWKGKNNEKRVETNDIERYVLTRTYTISTGRVEAVSGPAGAVTELIEQDVQVVSDAPDYYFTKLAELKVEMIGEATRDARGRANEIATNSGCQISEIRQARMGVLQITQPNSTEVSAGGMYDTSTIDKDVTSVVPLSLGLK
jgi:hypothetical protein